MTEALTKTAKGGAGWTRELGGQFRAPSVPPGDPVPFPVPISGGLQWPLIPIPGNPMTSSDLCGHQFSHELHMCPRAPMIYRDIPVFISIS